MYGGSSVTVSSSEGLRGRLYKGSVFKFRSSTCGVTILPTRWSWNQHNVLRISRVLDIQLASTIHKLDGTRIGPVIFHKGHHYG